MEPHDRDPVLTDVHSSPQTAATPSPGVPPLTLPPSVLLDQELQEAFQECEEQMASLGILDPAEPHNTTPEAEKKTGEVMVNKSNESSPLPPIVVQPGHNDGGHGNKSTHGNSEAANSQKDTVVFSFRNYILGTESGAGGPQQSDNHNHADAACGMNHGSDETPHRKQHVTRGVINDQDTPEHSAVGLKRAGEGGGGGGGGGEEVGERGGLAKEHSSFSQPEGSASGVSSAETETCPPPDAAESQLKSQSRSEPIATITESICTEQDRLAHPCQEQHAAAISPLPTQSEQSSSNTEGEARADLKQSVILLETLSPGPTCEETSVTETERHHSGVLLSLISPQPLTTSQQSPVEVVSNNQQVQTESSTTEAESETDPNMSEVGVSVCDNIGSNKRVHFDDTVKKEDNSSVGLRNTSVPAMDCASLPPLTVHESLHHPVVEASYIFQEFLNLKKPETQLEEAPTKDEPTIQSSADVPKPQKDVQLDRGDMGVEDTKETQERGLSGLSEDTLCAEVESGSEPQPVSDQSLHQTLTATVEQRSDRDTAPDWSAAPNQSQPTPAPNCFAQQQEQRQQQQLGSSHATEEFTTPQLIQGNQLKKPKCVRVQGLSVCQRAPLLGKRHKSQR
ncbi:uncharacterized protein [Centroberyx affinis]|uniref:uncharacterized protein n=1 Tax=Centroberyx affinis TaxID=166261 RepID=UPI003A5B9C4D